MLTVTAFNAAQNGVVTIGPDGAVIYTPDAGCTVQEAIGYTVFDGVSTDDATLFITVVNPLPVARDDAARTEDATPVEIPIADLLANDSDADDDLTLIAVGAAGDGTVALRPDGREVVRYTPDAGFVGVDAFTYTISDGLATAQATVSVTVENAPPETVDDALTVARGGSLAVDAAAGVLANDTDPDGDALTVTAFNPAANGALTIGPDGAITYTPNPDFVGVETVGYTVSDGAATHEGLLRITVFQPDRAPDAADDAFATTFGAPLTVAGGGALDGDADGVAGGDFVATFDVIPDNRPPEPQDDAGAVAEDGDAIFIDVLTNDEDPDGDPLTILSVGDAGFGTVTLDDGGVVYRPNADAFGEDSFTYIVEGAAGLRAEATVVVTVTPVNDAPVPGAPAARFGEDETGRRLDLLAGATDAEGDALSVRDVTVTAEDGRTVAFSLDGGALVLDDGGFEDLVLYEILGTEGSDILRGTDAPDLIRSLGGRVNVVFGGDGMDVFDFSASTANGMRETRQIADHAARELIDIGDAPSRIIARSGRGCWPSSTATGM